MDISEVRVLARRANGILFILPPFIILSGFCLVYSILVLTDAIVPDKDILCNIYLFTCLGGRRRYYSSYRYNRKIEHFNWAWDMEFVYNMGATQTEQYGFFPVSFDIILWECIICHGIYFLCFLIPFLARLFIPRIIMEYDDFGVYIYRTGSPVTLLRYKELWSTYSEVDFEDVEFCYHRGFYINRNIKIGDPFWGLIKTGSIRIETPDGFICLGGIYNVKEVERELKRMVRKNRKEFIDEMEENIKENQRKRELEELAKHNPDT